MVNGPIDDKQTQYYIPEKYLILTRIQCINMSVDTSIIYKEIDFTTILCVLTQPNQTFL
jgi:hypothetical protein